MKNATTYERILGKVLLASKDMNLEKIKAGLAWNYKKYENEQTPAERNLYKRQRDWAGLVA